MKLDDFTLIMTMLCNNHCINVHRSKKKKKKGDGVLIDT